MYLIRLMTLADYEPVIELLQQTPGVSLRDADSREATARYLLRNPNLSFVAHMGDQLAGCIMAGHDGRRGYLQHLTVRADYRRQGIANALVKQCVAELERLGIFKYHIDVFKTNTPAAAYWQGQGWQLRTDIDRYSLSRPGTENP
jgi:ribosomal protein S18 acetylase RimI-like enzyme